MEHSKFYYFIENLQNLITKFFFPYSYIPTYFRSDFDFYLSLTLMILISITFVLFGYLFLIIAQEFLRWLNYYKLPKQEIFVSVIEKKYVPQHKKSYTTYMYIGKVMVPQIHHYTVPDSWYAFVENTTINHKAWISITQEEFKSNKTKLHTFFQVGRFNSQIKFLNEE